MKFTKAFFGCKSGDIYPTNFVAGDDCPPELAEAAKSDGALNEPKPAPSNKARNAAPENK